MAHTSNLTAAQKQKLVASLGNPQLAYSPKQFIEATGICRTTVYVDMSEGILASVKVGKKRIIPGKCALDYLVRKMATGEWTGPEPRADNTGSA